MGNLLYYNHFYRKDVPTAFSPLVELSCQHKKKTKRLRIIGGLSAHTRKLGNFKKIPETLGFDGE